MKTVLVIAYLMGGHVIDTEMLDSATMEECTKTKQTALTGVTPVTTRYSADVQISAECRRVPAATELNAPQTPL